MENKTEKNIQAEILEKIKVGKVKMRPRYYFTCKYILLGLAALFFLVTAIFLVTFTFYALKINGTLALSGFGIKGMRDLLLSLPLTLFVITGIFLVTAAMFLKEYPSAYRRPLIYAVAVLLVIVSGGAALIMYSADFRRELDEQLVGAEMPFLSDAYEYYRNQYGRNIHLGQVSRITDEGIEIINREGGRQVIIFSPQTIFSGGYRVREGDYVIIHGEDDGEMVGAFVVKRLEQ